MHPVKVENFNTKCNVIYSYFPFRALLKIRGFLKSEDITKAIKLFRIVMETWGDVEELQVTDQQIETESKKKENEAAL